MPAIVQIAPDINDSIRRFVNVIGSSFSRSEYLYFCVFT